MFMVDAQAQEVYKLQSKNSKLTIEGTSSIHDWEMKAENFKAETLLQMKGEVVSEISNVEFSTPVSGLKSGKSIMDKKAHDALKEKKSPEIKFALNKNNNVSISGTRANFTGLLTVAGKTKEVSLSAQFDIENPQKFLVSGSVPIKMSDFGVDPPTAMMGTIKTHDEVVVQFNLEFQKSSQEYTGNY